MGTGAPPGDFLVVVNPAAGDGRCAREAPGALERLRQAGLRLDVVETAAPRDAVRVARDAYAAGRRHFLAAGGDGTAFEVLNGVMPAALETGERPLLGFLPLGTGNAYLRDFFRGTAGAIEAIATGRRRETDVLVLRHRDGRSFFLNLIGFGFAAEVSERTHKGLKRFGVFGYTLAVLLCLARLRYTTLPMALDGGEVDARPTTLVSVSNSRYTADMLLAPQADIADGRADVVRVAPLGRLALLRAFPLIFSGRHLTHPAVSVAQAASLRFEARGEVPVMIDGEIVRLVPQSVEVIERGLEICA